MLSTRLTFIRNWRDVNLLVDLVLLGHEVVRCHRAPRGAKAGSSIARQNRNLFTCINRNIEMKTLQKPNISISKNTKASEKGKKGTTYIKPEPTEAGKSISCMTLVEIFDLVSTHARSILGKLARAQGAKGSDDLVDNLFHGFHEPLAWDGVHRKQKCTTLRHRDRGNGSIGSIGSIESGNVVVTGREDAPARTS